ncbi:twin-arginine translocation signal domain-containing protein, partial [Paenibacillus septentrionalis]|uniref:twin-arginine translocation signal domain-containing protein n=1 Tax=Paenibacillus septentrionalis TaxID=429342 RepID=UPI003631036A
MTTILGGKLVKPTEPQTKLSRRSFLKVSGAALLLLSGGGLYRAVDQGVFST